MAVIYVEGGDFDAYQKTIEKIEALPIHQLRATVMGVCLEEIELLQYPVFDVEFHRNEGAQKLGVTGPPARVAEVMRLIGRGT